MTSLANLVILALFVPATSVANITVSEVTAAQRAWGNALVGISTMYDIQGFAAAKAMAESVIDSAYAYKTNGQVLFKPTLTYGNQTFRISRAGALAYFVGGDVNYPNDTGFALKSWREFEIRNAAIFLEGNTGTTMGNVILTDINGAKTMVDKTWQFLKGDDGKLRIVLHHSSLPYAPAPLPLAAVTLDDVVAAQKAWGQALVNISTVYDNSGFAAAKALAGAVIDAAYAFDSVGTVFKPTLTIGNQTFRLTRAGALAYFVGGDPNFPNDSGFALKSWRKVEIQNAQILLEGNSGTSMGNVIITDKSGSSVMVDKTWRFVRGSDGKLRITIHHSSLPYTPSTPSPVPITADEVRAAQRAWGKALVDISITYDQAGFAAAKALAGQVIDAAYNYQNGEVLFKPTLTYGNQTFRTTRAGALAYFVGGDPNYPNDNGFAFKSWRHVEIKNVAIYLNGNTGTSMGNVILTDINGAQTKVDKTWTFVKGSDGNLRISLHHSSLPYSPYSPSSSSPQSCPPNITTAEIEAAQKAWGRALVTISTTYDNQGLPAAKAIAGQILDAAYNYQNANVLFKPTLTFGNQTFRITRDGALAYFVGDDANYPNDNGFAFKSWRKVEIKNAALYINCNTGVSMGNVFLTDVNGAVTKVDKTWIFWRSPDGTLRIALHHSSLPYNPNAPSTISTISSGSDDSNREKTVALGIGLSCAVIVVINACGVAFIGYFLSNIFKLNKLLAADISK